MADREDDTVAGHRGIASISDWLAAGGRVVDEHLLWLVLASVAFGVLVPEIAVVTAYATPILAVMVGSISLTLTASRFRGVPAASVLAALAGHVVMPAVAFAIAVALGLQPALVAGFVVLGAVTPELVTPTMTELADGDTALAAVLLVIAGVAATLLVPASLDAFVGTDVPVDATRIVHGLLLAVVGPMLAAIALRHRYDATLAPHESAYGTISAIAVVVIIGGVTAANADLLRVAPARTARIAAGALALNATGYAIGYVAGDLATRASDRSPTQNTGTRVATTLSVGMRDFAVAAALVVAAGLPPEATLPAVTFGVVEMMTSAALVAYAP
jgi:BASS family bile acid:Na+ symporter